MDCVNHPGVDALNQCIRCRAPICPDCEARLEGRSICRSCLAQIREQIASRYRAETYQVNYCGAFLCAALVATLAALCWSQLVVWTTYPLEFLGALLGGAVGYAARMGAGDKRGRPLQQLAAAITLVGIFLAHYLIFYRAFFRDPAWQGYAAPLLAFPAYLSASFDWLDWVFLAVGVAWAYWVPHVRQLRD